MKEILNRLFHLFKLFISTIFEVIVNEGGNHDVKLIGIVSRYIPFKQEWVNYRDNLVNAEYVNSGYTVVMSTDLIIQTIELIPSRSGSNSIW